MQTAAAAAGLAPVLFVLAETFEVTRESNTAPRRILVGAPSGQLDLQRYLRFLFACAAWGVLYWLYRRKIFFKA